MIGGLGGGLKKAFKVPGSSGNSSGDSKPLAKPSGNSLLQSKKPNLLMPKSNGLSSNSNTSSTYQKPLLLSNKSTTSTTTTSQPVVKPKFEPFQKKEEKAEESIQDQRSYFAIFYTKDKNKKTKKFNDGILEITRVKVRVYDPEGSTVYETMRGKFFKDKPRDEEEYYLGSYLIQISNPIPFEEFSSGRCFLKRGELNANPAASLAPKTFNSTGLNKKMKQTPKKNLELKTDIEVPEGACLLTEPNNDKVVPTFIDAFLAQTMRLHQREGVKFMFECICGFKGAEISGCILADSMGLGKTLQTIALMWTLFKRSPFANNKPFIKKAIVVAPLTLVRGWEKEIIKWLGGERIKPLVAIGNKDQVTSTVQQFADGYYKVLLISYEQFRGQYQKLEKSCDLLIFDEGHRLKNNNLKTNQAFAKFKCRRRVILTGTPLQNRLEELFACCDFINPGIFGTMVTFKKVYDKPILDGLRKNASPADQAIAKDRSKELSKTIQKFILRRPGTILKAILPPKHELIILLSMSEVQLNAYKALIHEKIFGRYQMADEVGEVFSLINVMRKLLNHPGLLFGETSESSLIVQKQFPEGEDMNQQVWKYSQKLMFTKDLLEGMESDEKVVIVSYFTQTLDVIEKVCSAVNMQYLRLDGSVQAQKRQGLVDKFQDRSSPYRVFLLGAKAGGTAANKMILFEADWNPSNDAQVMGRIWRDGQKREALIYRLVSCGSIEEKIIQRQALKENLSLNIVDEKNIKNAFDTSDAKKIFKFENDITCVSYKPEEDVKDEVFEDGSLTTSMKKYIRFVKRNTDKKVEENKGDDFKNEKTVKNQFEDGNIFLQEDEEDKEVDQKESEYEPNTLEGTEKEGSMIDETSRPNSLSVKESEDDDDSSKIQNEEDEGEGEGENKSASNIEEEDNDNDDDDDESEKSTKKVVRRRKKITGMKNKDSPSTEETQASSSKKRRLVKNSKIQIKVTKTEEDDDDEDEEEKVNSQSSNSNSEDDEADEKENEVADENGEEEEDEEASQELKERKPTKTEPLDKKRKRYQSDALNTPEQPKTGKSSANSKDSSGTSKSIGANVLRKLKIF